MKSYQQVVNEVSDINEGKSDYEIYHSSYTSAVQEVEKFVNKNRLYLDKEEMASEIGFGQPKPKPGKTNRFSLKLYKKPEDVEDQKHIKKQVHFQIYGMGSAKYMSADKYELNMYIS